MSKQHLPGRITATRGGLDIAAQTVHWHGAAYEIEAQTITIDPPEHGAIYRLAIVDGALRLDETPDGEIPDARGIDLATLILGAGQRPDEGQLIVERIGDGNATAEKTVQAGPVQRKTPSPAQVARRAQRAAARVVREKLARGDVLTPQEVSEALRVVMERVG